MDPTRRAECWIVTSQRKTRVAPDRDVAGKTFCIEAADRRLGSGVIVEEGKYAMSNVGCGEGSNKVGKLPSPASNPSSGEVEEVEVFDKMRVEEPERTFEESPVRIPFSENNHSTGEQEILIHEVLGYGDKVICLFHPAAGDQSAQIIYEMLLRRGRLEGDPDNVSMVNPRESVESPKALKHVTE